MMSDWQQAAFAFLETSLHSLTTGNRGATVISRATLVQDHADHGIRATDVECFSRALYARWTRHLVTPPQALYKHIVQHYIHKYYGHLRQGPRLLLSHCDFLQLGPDYPFWQNALCASGMLHLIPNAHPNADPDDGAAAPPPNMIF